MLTPCVCEGGPKRCVGTYRVNKYMDARRLVGALAAAAGLALLLFRRRLRSQSSLVALLRSGRKAVCVGKNYREHITELAQLGPEWTLEEEPEPRRQHNWRAFAVRVGRL